MSNTNPSNNNDAPTRVFSVDLVTLSRQHIQFLREIHSTSVSFWHHHAPEESLRRYQDLWLPFVYDQQEEEGDNDEEAQISALIPPPDVAWLWHCHRLAPQRYESYIRNRFCSYDNHSHKQKKKPLFAPFCFQRQEDSTSFSNQKLDSSSNKTRQLWETVYPTEAFFLKEEKQQETTPAAAAVKEECLLLSDGFDIGAACRSQATFLWHVSGSQYTNSLFLQQAEEDYLKFLNLKNDVACSQHQVLVPTIAIDLMWHTHILSDLASLSSSKMMDCYKHDCLKILGTTFYHDDSIAENELDVFFHQTASLWKQVYQQDYHVLGAMSCGDPPAEYFDPMWTTNRKSPSSLVQKKKQKKSKSYHDFRWVLLGMLLLLVIVITAAVLLSLVKGGVRVDSLSTITTTTTTTVEQEDDKIIYDDASWNFKQWEPEDLSEQEEKRELVNDVFDPNDDNSTDAAGNNPPTDPPSQSMEPSQAPIINTPKVTPATTIAPTPSPTPRPLEWVCGGGTNEPPVPDLIGDNNNTSVPKCLEITATFRSNGLTVPFERPLRPLCLSWKQLNNAPTWCYDFNPNFHLWYSICPDCASPAWRLDEEVNDRKSWYKNPTDDPNQSVPPLFEDSEGWLRWGGDQEPGWFNDVVISMTPCDAATQCWVDSSTKLDDDDTDDDDKVTIGGIILAIVFFLIMICVCVLCCFCCIAKGGGGGGGGFGHNRHGHHNNHGAGSGCGGGGGGCGGGGGGGGCGGA